MKRLRLGVGAGFAGDRIDPAVQLAKHGQLQYLVFECLAERTIALAQEEKEQDPSKGYNAMLERRLKAVLPHCVEQGTKIITNMGAANPLEAAKATVRVARTLGLSGLKVAAVTGDDVLDHVLEDLPAVRISGGGGPLEPSQVISANAYLGAAPIVEALKEGAHVVITGRAADPAMFLAPLIHDFGWSFDDWDKLGRGSLYGHLLECAGQISGGYFADTRLKTVPDLARLGFPYIEVDEEGGAVITKLPNTGGMISRATCSEQLLYEIHDPSRYYQPDVIADFSEVDFVELGPDRVQVIGGCGTAKTGQLKVSVGYLDSWVGEGQISYAGPLAVERGRYAIDILHQRLEEIGLNCLETRCELIGVDSVMEGGALKTDTPFEVRMRFAARCSSEKEAAQVCEEVEGLYLNGPSGGGGVTKSVRKVIAIGSTFVPEALVEPVIEIMEV